MALTARIRLEPLTPSHAAALFLGLADPALYAFIDDEPPVDEAALRVRYERWARGTSPDGTQKWLNWAIRSLAENRYVGTVQATVTRTMPGARESACEERAELAYVLFREWWGHGYGRESVALVIEQLGVDRVTATVDARNRRSVALLTAIGFVRVGEWSADTKFERVLSRRA